MNREEKTIQVRIELALYKRIYAAAEKEAWCRPNVSKIIRRTLRNAFPA